MNLAKPDRLCEKCSAPVVRVKRGKFYCLACYELEIAKPPVPHNQKPSVSCWRCKTTIVWHKEEMPSAYREGEHVICYTCYHAHIAAIELDLFD